jgi:tetratricopeptide (TPR) repeat protein
MQDVHAGRDIIFGTKPLFERVYDRFAASLGLWGQIAVGVLILVWLCLWYWQHIEQMPLIDAMVSWFGEQSLPRADPDRFAIAVANLKDDADHHLEDRLIYALRNFEEGERRQDVEILRFDRQISSDGTEGSDKAGYEQARKYLRGSGAQVLIWGSVLHNRKDNAYRLYWTTSDPSDPGRLPKTPYQIEEDFKLPRIFWNDLVDVLKLLVVSESTHYFNLPGRFIADKLRPFVVQVRQLFDGSQGQAGWNTSTRGEIGRILAWALEVLGEQGGDDQALKESISVSKDILKIISREQEPLDWAMTQNALGSAHTVLGQRESSTQHLTEAVKAYNAALQESTRERAPLQWAMIQNNLGVALMYLGEGEAGKEYLEEAVKAYNAALQESTRERAPLQWAMIQNNLGAALGWLGARETGTNDLEEAVAADRKALKEYTRERTPLDWANIQLNMGGALSDLGHRETGTNDLKQAVNADQEALKEYTRERTPLDWANIQLNMGAALRRLGERETGTNDLEEAVAADRKALLEYTLKRTPVEWATTQINLGLALATLGEREAGTNHLEAGTNQLKEAVEHYCDALEVFTREQDPERWAITQYNLGAALLLLGDREPGTKDLEQAVVRCSAALEMLTREQDPEHWAEAQNDLGDAQRDLAERTNDAHLLCAALQGHLNAWEVSAGAAPYNASIAAKGAREDVGKLRERLAPAAFLGCTTQYAQTLKQMGLP